MQIKTKPIDCDLIHNLFCDIIYIRCFQAGWVGFYLILYLYFSSF